MFDYSHPPEFDFPSKVRLLQRACAEAGLRFEPLQPREGFLWRVSEGARFVNLHLSAVTVNLFNSHILARDKVYTYRILGSAGIGIPRGDYYLKPGSFPKTALAIGRSISEALIEGVALGTRCSLSDARTLVSNSDRAPFRFSVPLIVKPNTLEQSRGVFMVYSLTELASAMMQVFELDSVAIIQEYIDKKEFRLVMLDGEVVLAYEKAGPKLREKTNGEIAHLQEAMVRDVTGEVPAEYKEWGKVICAELKLRFAGIDFRCDGLDSPTGNAVVLEVNSNPGFADYLSQHDEDRVVGVYGRLLRLLLRESMPTESNAG